MSDPTGVPSGLGIESVEWFAEGGEKLTVRVTGRWRKRRPTWTGRPLLVIEANGRRHRFPAMPEPPSLTGPAAGTWRMNFSIPASLAPHLRGHAWLKLGVVVLKLPMEVEHAELSEGRVSEHGLGPSEHGPLVQDSAEEAALLAEGAPGQGRPSESRSSPDPDSGAAALLRSAGLAIEASRARLAEADELASELSRRIEQLELELAEASQEPIRLQAELTEREALLHAAEHAAAAARVARERAEQRVAELEAGWEAEGRGPGRLTLRSGVRTELRLAGVISSGSPTPSPVAPAHADLELLALERELLARGRAHAAEERATALEHELQEQSRRVSRALAAIEQLRGELEEVREDRARELLAMPAARQIDPEKFAVALQRLRAHPPAADPAEPLAGPGPSAEGAGALAADGSVPEVGRDPRGGWLARAFQQLTEQDASAAGLLALGLLPALGRVHRAPIAFDLVLAELGCVRVTAGTERVEVDSTVSPRRRDETGFRVIGDVQSFARLLAAGPFRRRIGRRVAAVEGDRRALRTLLELVRAPLDLLELHDAGVRLDPWLALGVVAVMVRPRWTKGERFTIAHRERSEGGAGTYLHVSDGERLSVSHRTPLGPVGTTILCSSDAILPVLGGAQRVGVEVQGAQWPLELLQDWVKRAQSG